MMTVQREVPSSLTKDHNSKKSLKTPTCFQGLGVATWKLDISSSRLKGTSKVKALSGKQDERKQQTLFKNLLQQIHTDDQDRVTAMLSDSISQCRPLYEQQFRVCHADGSIRKILSRAQLQLDGDGNPKSLRGIDIDITDAFDPSLGSSKNAEVQLYQRYLLKLEESLRLAKTLGEVILAACSTLGEALGVARVGFGEIEEDNAHLNVEHEWRNQGIPSALGRHSFADYGLMRIAPALTGRMTVTNDVLLDLATSTPEIVARFAAMNVRSVIELPLMSDGKTRALMFVCDSAPRSWTEPEIELGRQTLARIWQSVDRVRAEENLRVSEEKYWSLFNSIDEGFCIVQMLYDKTDKPIDYRFLETNKAFEQQTGLVNAVGKTARELVPNLEQYWIDIYGKAGLKGESVRFQHGSTEMGRWFDVYATPIGDRRKRNVAIVFNDISARKRDEQAVHDSEERLRLAAQASEFGVYEFDPALKQSVWSSELFTILGITPRDRVDLSVLFAAVHPDDQQSYQTFQDQAVDESTGGSYEHSYRIVRPNGEVRWVTEKGREEFAGEGDDRRAVKARGTIVDFTRRKQQEEHTEFLMKEVNHRAKNLLAVVQAVAQQTAKKSDPRNFAEHFGRRLSGLAASHDLLVQSEWRGVDLRELICSQLSHFADSIGSRIRLDGPRIDLSASAAQAIGMAIHELATNAGKHGALSDVNGVVDVKWQLDDYGKTSTFVIQWSESGGPPCVSPKHRGFGHTVIVGMVEHALEAKVSLSYPATGLKWLIEAPASKIMP
jgi:PAS domain S-box-containing protein